MVDLAASATGDLQLRNIRKEFGEFVAVDDLNLTIPKGSFFALLGPSGCGKTTLISVVAGILDQDNGSCELFGENLQDMSSKDKLNFRARNIGFVFQSFQLIDHLTALENVQLPLELAGMPRAEAAAKAQVWLEKVGLSERLKHRPKTLSGGEQQRVALARAFVTEPDILFADEPTGSLDEQNGQKIIELLFQLNQELGSTLILVTHDMALASRCERQMVLNNGRVVVAV